MNRKTFEERFKIHSEIGKGQYGFVFQAEDTVLQKPCAVKKITLKQVFGKNQQVEYQKTMLERELNILKNFEHENIVKLIEGCQQENEFLFALELCDHDLSLILKEKEKSKSQMTEADARVIFNQIVDAMFYLSQNNVCHRDLKPANILLKAGIVQIADFGMGREINTAQTQEQIEMTVKVGTPLYCSPEVNIDQDKNYDPYKLDVWSGGIILYEMLYGFLPYDLIKCKSKLELNQYLKGKELEFQSKIPVSDEAKELIAFMLMKQPDLRYNWEQVREHKWILDEKKRIIGETKKRGQRRKTQKNQESENLVNMFRLDLEIFNFISTTLEMINKKEQYLIQYNLFREHQIVYTCYGLIQLALNQFSIYQQEKSIREQYLERYATEKDSELEFHKQVFEIIKKEVKSSTEKHNELVDKAREYEKCLDQYYQLEEISSLFEGKNCILNLQINLHNIIQRTFHQINPKEDETVLMILLHLSLFEQFSNWSLFDLKEKLCKFQNLSNQEAIEIIHLK